MRLFYCLELPSEIRQALYRLGEPLRRTEARGTWVRSENLHITVKFLGEVASSRSEQLRALGEESAREMKSFELCFDTVGAFPNFARPRVLWVGCGSAPETLFQFHRKLEAALQKMGFAAEDRFAPHATLGRIKEASPTATAHLAEAVRAIKPFELRAPITALTLMESRLTPQGSLYAPLGIFAFADS